MEMGDSSDRIITVSSAIHHDTLVKGLWNFYKRQHGVDLFLQSGKKMISAHQLIMDVFLPDCVLDLASEYFDDSLTLLLEFLYTGKVAVNKNQLNNLRKVAQQFKFQMLIAAIQSIDLNDQISTTPGTLHELRKSNEVTNSTTSVQFLKSDHYGQVKSRFSQKQCIHLSEESNITEALLTLNSNESTNPSDMTNDGTSRNDNDQGTCKHSLAHGLLNTSESSATTDNFVIPPTLHCSDCTFVSTKDNESRVHQCSHDPIVIYFKCHTCKQSFPCADSLLYRGKTVHGGNASLAPAVLQCPSCGYQQCCTNQIQKLSNYLVHFLESHKVDDEGLEAVQLCKCSHCNFTCTSDEDMAHHVLSQHVRTNCVEMHSQRVYHCAKCDYTCASITDRRKHLLEHSDIGPAPCQECKHVATNQKALHVHLRKEHHKSTVRLCEMCGYQCFTTSRMKKHKTKHTGEKPFVCDQCGRTFGIIEALKKHCKWVHTLHAFSCKCCERSFRSANTLARHHKKCGAPIKQRAPPTRKYHRPPSRPILQYPRHGTPVRCHLCQCMLLGMRSMLKHLDEEHPNEPRFHCKHCAYTCKNPWRMQQHQRIHTGEKPFKCQYCMKEFSDSRSFKRHERIHISTKTPHPCPQCGKNFDSPEYLQTHLKVVHKIIDLANKRPAISLSMIDIVNEHDVPRDERL